MTASPSKAEETRFRLNVSCYPVREVDGKDLSRNNYTRLAISGESAVYR